MTATVRSSQMVTTAVTPAPTPRLDSPTLERFADLGIKRVALSLDGATAARHDRFRGEDGSFETIRRAAERAAELGLPIQINTTVTGSTVHDLPGISNLVEQLGAVMWEVFFLVPIGRGTDLEPLSPGHSDQIVEWLYRRQRDAPFRVITVEAPHYRRVAKQVEQDETGADAHVGSTGDGKGFNFVSHLGEVYPSGFLPMSVGNIRDANVVPLYREAPLLQQFRDPDGFTGPCGECPIDRSVEDRGLARSRPRVTRWPVTLSVPASRHQPWAETAEFLEITRALSGESNCA